MEPALFVTMITALLAAVVAVTTARPAAKASELRRAAKRRIAASDARRAQIQAPVRRAR